VLDRARIDVQGICRDSRISRPIRRKHQRSPPDPFGEPCRKLPLTPPARKVPAAQSSQAGRENITIQHPCRSSTPNPGVPSVVTWPSPKAPKQIGRRSSNRDDNEDTSEGDSLMSVPCSKPTRAPCPASRDVLSCALGHSVDLARGRAGCGMVLLWIVPMRRWWRLWRMSWQTR
jgi:hypothetical protein